MTSNLVYAIVDLESGWFVTRGINSGLEELGVNTLFFKSKHDAYKFKKQKIHSEYGINKPTVLENNLAWWLLEKVYKTDRWHINCDLQEYNDALANVSRLKVVPINLEYNTNVYK